MNSNITTQQKESYELQLNTRDTFKLTPPSSYTNVFYGNPEITFLSSKTTENINHCREFINIKPDNDPNFGIPITFTIEKKFDILEKCWIKMRLPSIFSRNIIDSIRNEEITYKNKNDRIEYLNGIGYYIFNHIQLYIDGVCVQEITPEMLHIYHYINNNTEKTLTTRSDLHGYFGSKNIYNHYETTYNDEYIIEIPFYFNYEQNNLPIPCLRNKTVQIICNIKPIHDLLHEPFTNKELCQMEPFEKSVIFNPINGYNGNLSGSQTTKSSVDMILDSFELLCSAVYLDIDMRNNMIKSDITQEFIFSQQFRETFKNLGNERLINMKIEPSGIARYIYIFARLLNNEKKGDYVNLTNEIIPVSSDYNEKPRQRIIKNVSLRINRENIFQGKRAELLEYQEAMHSNVDYFQNTLEPIIIIPLIDNKTKGSIIYDRFDDIQLQFLVNNDVSEDINIYVICENSNQLRINKQMGGLVFG